MPTGRTHSSGEGPICPYCEKEQSSAGNDYWAEKAGSGEHECADCGATFKFNVDYTTHYYAQKKFPEIWIVKETPWRRIVALGYSAVDPDILVSHFEGDEGNKIWLIEASGAVLLRERFHPQKIVCGNPYLYAERTNTMKEP